MKNFGRVPHHAQVLEEAGALISKDLSILSCLMELGVKDPVVFARQETLARKKRCSVKTIQRSLARLEKAGFLRRLYENVSGSRVRSKGYDMSLSIAMVTPEKATAAAPNKATFVSAGRNADAQSKTPQTPPKQSDTRVRVELDSGVCRKKQTSPPNSSLPPQEMQSPVVVGLVESLRDVGISEREASQWIEKKGEARVKTVLEAFGERNARKKVRDPAGWIVDALAKGWIFPPLSERERPSKEAKPAVYQPFQPRGVPVGTQALANFKTSEINAGFQAWRSRQPRHSEAVP